MLLRELSCWEAASKTVSRSRVHDEPAGPSPSWFVLRENVSRLTHRRPAPSQQLPDTKAVAANQDLTTAVTSQLRAACTSGHWVVVQGGARFVQVLIGLFPHILSTLSSETLGVHTQPHVTDGTCDKPSATKLFDELTHALHELVLGPSREKVDKSAQTNETGDGCECAAQLLATLLEIAGKLRPHELDALGTAFQKPSLCALLGEPPSPGSLHPLCMQLLQALLASTELYALAHGADSHENPLLAVANLLVVPTVEPRAGDSANAGSDNAELQQCRVLALQVFCRCLASAPRIDMMLQLRAPTVNGETVDTVLHRVVFLCHHELLCLGLHGIDGGPWHDPSLEECAKRRQRAVELALMILSSFVWHATPWTPEMKAPDHAIACSDACVALGRMRPLVASIVDMVVRRASGSTYYTRLLGSASALRVLLAHVDGDDSGNASGDDGARLGESERVAAMAPMVVE